MTRYRIKCAAEAVITEVWEVEAASPDDAQDELFAGNAVFIEQSEVDSESNRDVFSIEEV